MAEPHQQSNTDTADGALDRLEAALETIARGLEAPKPSAAAAPAADLRAIESRVDAAIAHIHAALGRVSDQ